MSRLQGAHHHAHREGGAGGQGIRPGNGGGRLYHQAFRDEGGAGPGARGPDRKSVV